MVSFTSLVVLSLVAASQLVQSTVVPPNDPFSYAQCEEHPELSGKTIPTSHFDKAKLGERPQFLGSQGKGLPTSVQTEWSQVTGKDVTTIDTYKIVSFQNYVSIGWTTKDGSLTSRYFKIFQDQKCRVENSSDYVKLLGATFQYPGTH